MAPLLARVVLSDALFCWPVSEFDISEFNVTQNAVDVGASEGKLQLIVGA